MDLRSLASSRHARKCFTLIAMMASATLNCGRVGFASEAAIVDAANDEWWNEDWNTRQQLTFLNSTDEHLIDVPVYVALDQAALHIDTAATNLRIVAADGSLLPFEIEAIRSGLVHVWVKVPQISPRSRTEYMWAYADSAVTNGVADRNAPWSDAFGLVMHMTGQARDSALQNSVVVDASGGTVDGKIAGALQFNGLSQYLRIADQPGLHAVTGLVITAWIRSLRTTPPNFYPAVINRQSAAGSFYDDFSIAQDVDSLVRLSCAIGETQTSTKEFKLTTDSGLDKWHAVAIVIDANSLVASSFLDGEFVNSVGLTARTESNRPIWIGASTNSANDSVPNVEFLQGIVDEVRVHRVVRSASWLKADYLIQTQQFVRYGVIERR